MTGVVGKKWHNIYSIHDHLGDTMRFAAKEFADDPCSSSKRANMIRAARALLSAVTRLLCVADMADVYRLLASLKLVSKY
jgi:catenin alpha